MSVHEAITSHSKKQHAHLERFKKLDAAREQAIEETVSLCAAGRSFSVDDINRITAEINEHANQGISPTRKYVTTAMIQEYINQ